MINDLIQRYDSLNDDTKAKVSNYDRLEAAQNECEFLAGLQESVESRMKNKDSSEYSALVDTELAYLDQYRSTAFLDDNVANARDDYLKGLDAQKKALKSKEQYSEYQVLWSKGKVLRYKALKALNEENSFMQDNAEFVGEYVKGYDHEKAYYDAIRAIEKDIGKQDKANKIDCQYLDDGHTVKMILKNNTKYSFDSTWEIDTRTSTGTVVESAETSVKAKPHAKYVVTFYLSNTSFYNFDWNNYYSDIYV